MPVSHTYYFTYQNDEALAREHQAENKGYAKADNLMLTRLFIIVTSPIQEILPRHLI
jgi:hypothetical protein